MLMARGAKMPPSGLLIAANEGQEAIVQYLLDHGAAVNVRDDYGRTPLILAAHHYPNQSVVKLLLKAGADVNARDGDGKTALMLAAPQGDPETVRFLLHHGADLSARNRWGQTALGYAVAAHQTAVVHMLKQAARIESGHAPGPVWHPKPIPPGRSFRGASLPGAHFDRAYLQRADLGGARLMA
jgi:hypothetical protein